MYHGNVNNLIQNPKAVSKLKVGKEFYYTWRLYLIHFLDDILLYADLHQLVFDVLHV